MVSGAARIGGRRGAASHGGELTGSDGLGGLGSGLEQHADAGNDHLGGLVASRGFPKAITLTGGIGAGLTVSALTNTCAMGRALSWLPFNRSQPTKIGRDYLEKLPTR